MFLIRKSIYFCCFCLFYGKSYKSHFTARLLLNSKFCLYWKCVSIFCVMFVGKTCYSKHDVLLLTISLYIYNFFLLKHLIWHAVNRVHDWSEIMILEVNFLWQNTTKFIRKWNGQIKSFGKNPFSVCFVCASLCSLDHKCGHASEP